jgi:hypothetical protein
MLMKLSKGAIGYASASFATPFARRPFEIHGTKGSLLIENSFAYLTASEDPGPKLTIINQAGSSTRDYAPTECFRLEIEQFNRAIEGKGEPMTTAYEGLRALAIGEAFYEAIRGGRVARVAEFMVPTGSRTNRNSSRDLRMAIRIFFSAMPSASSRRSSARSQGRWRAVTGSSFGALAHFT